MSLTSQKTELNAFQLVVQGAFLEVRKLGGVACHLPVYIHVRHYITTALDQQRMAADWTGVHQTAQLLHGFETTLVTSSVLQNKKIYIGNKYSSSNITFLIKRQMLRAISLTILLYIYMVEKLCVMERRYHVVVYRYLSSKF
jgi:hypothetical protein